MRRPVLVSLAAVVLALVASAAAQAAIIGPAFSFSPFTKAQTGAGNAVTLNLNWLPAQFLPTTANDKQTLIVTDLAGGGPQTFSAASTAGSAPLLLSDGHQYTITVAACSTPGSAPCDPSSVGTAAESGTTRVDATPPSGTVQVNGGAAATNNRNVTLSLTATDPLILGAPGTSSGVNQVAPDVDGDGTTPCIFFGTPDTSGCAVAFAPTLPVTIPAGPDGLKKVGAFFGDGARVNTSPCPPLILCATLLGSFIEGNRSAEATDEILLDTTKPVAAPSPAATTIERGSSVTFSSGGSTDPAPASGVVAASAAWNFADGSPVASGATVTHTFTAAGTFVGSLRVKDVAGNVSDAKAFAVTVNPKPGETVNGSGSIAGVRGTAAFSVARLKVKARYRRSRLIGSVSVVGASTQPGSLRLVLRRGAAGTGKVLHSKSSKIRAAGFAKSLALPATLTPGRYTLTLAGPGGTLTTLLTLTPPREGVLAKAAIAQPGAGARATFRFAARPVLRLRGKLAVTWSQGARVLGVVQVGSGATVTAGLPAGARVSAGRLVATLRAGSTVVGSATARVR